MCRILAVPTTELQESFNEEASDSIKHSSRYARNFLEYCCFRTLALSTQIPGHLDDKKFRRLTFDMMVAWEVPAATSEPVVDVSFIILHLQAFCHYLGTDVDCICTHTYLRFVSRKSL